MKDMLYTAYMTIPSRIRTNPIQMYFNHHLLLGGLVGTSSKKGDYCQNMHVTTHISIINTASVCCVHVGWFINNENKYVAGTSRIIQ